MCCVWCACVRPVPYDQLLWWYHFIEHLLTCCMLIAMPLCPMRDFQQIQPIDCLSDWLAGCRHNKGLAGMGDGCKMDTGTAAVLEGAGKMYTGVQYRFGQKFLRPVLFGQKCFLDSALCQFSSTSAASPTPLCAVLFGQFSVGYTASASPLRPVLFGQSSLASTALANSSASLLRPVLIRQSS